MGSIKKKWKISCFACHCLKLIYVFLLRKMCADCVERGVNFELEVVLVCDDFRVGVERLLGRFFV